jgi:hypothetical protein
MRPALLSAYRNTLYQTAGYQTAGITIRVGRRSGATDQLLSSCHAQTAVLVTAYNPLSRVMPPGWNQRMQARLLKEVRRRRVLPATGSLRHWTEAHLLVFGDVGPTQRLARRYRQRAVVIVRLRQPARLVITLPPARP